MVHKVGRLGAAVHKAPQGHESLQPTC